MTNIEQPAETAQEQASQQVYRGESVGALEITTNIGAAAMTLGFAGLVVDRFLDSDTLQKVSLYSWVGGLVIFLGSAFASTFNTRPR